MNRLFVAGLLLFVGLIAFAFFNNQRFDALTILKESGVELDNAPEPYNDEYASNVIEQLITPEEKLTLAGTEAVEQETRSIMQEYENGSKTLSFQKYFDYRLIPENPQVKSLVLSLDKKENTVLRHKIVVGTDMAGWDLVKKESSYPDEPFSRIYVLVQRQQEAGGRMVGLSFYEGSYAKIEYEGNVNEKSIDDLVELTWKVADRQPSVYNNYLKEISEGEIFADTPVFTRPDLPDPDLE